MEVVSTAPMREEKNLGSFVIEPKTKNGNWRAASLQCHQRYRKFNSVMFFWRDLEDSRASRGRILMKKFSRAGLLRPGRRIAHAKLLLVYVLRHTHKHIASISETSETNWKSQQPSTRHFRVLTTDSLTSRRIGAKTH